MFKRLIAVILMLASHASAQQNPRQSNITGMQVLGQAVAAEFGRWEAPVLTQVTATGSRTVSVEGSAFVVPQGQGFMPLQTSIPIRVNDGPNSETVTPSAVSCSQGSGICNFTATFANTHKNNFKIQSATFGLQEAIQFAHQKGGQVLVTSDWGGTTSLITNANGYTNVSVYDTRAGGNQWYFWNGSDYVISFGFSASGATAISSTGTLASSFGAMITGPIGANASIVPGFRTDAHLALTNASCYLAAAHCHVILEFLNQDRTEESGTTYYGFRSDGVGIQLASTFVRFVNSVNTVGNYKTVWCNHQPDSTSDTTSICTYSNNSIKLLAGSTSAEPWTTAPADNSLDIYGNVFTHQGAGQNFVMAGLGAGLGAVIASINDTNTGLLPAELQGTTVTLSGGPTYIRVGSSHNFVVGALASGAVLASINDTNTGLLPAEIQGSTVRLSGGATTISAGSGQNVLVAGSGTGAILASINDTNTGLRTLEIQGSTVSITGNSSLTFAGNLLSSGGYIEGIEIAPPAAPGAGKGRIYFEDNGAGKVQLTVRFPSGAAQIIKTEP